MRHTWVRRIGIVTLVGWLLMAGWELGVTVAATPAPSDAAVQSAYGHLPLSFEANQGQVESHVQFLTRGRGHTLFLTPSEAVLSLRTGEANGKGRGGDIHQNQPSSNPLPPSHSVVRMTFKGANPQANMVGLDKLPGIVNYIFGDDPSKWRTNIPTYQKVAYTNVYPGIDLVYYGKQGQLEYDPIVAPGADPTQITLAFEGVEHMTKDEDGNLVLAVHQGQVRLLKPQVYQVADGKRTHIAASYVLHASNSALVRPVDIQLAFYDVSKALIIDPVLSYSTYLGGGGDDAGFGIAVDGSGNAYLTGYTSSSNFPTANPLQATLGGTLDAFVAKLNPTGSALVYSTYLGGSGEDAGSGLAVDGSGNAYIGGWTSSSDFPTANPLQATFGGGLRDAFVAKLNAAGILVYSTYLGGRAFDSGIGLAVDGAGNAYISGRTEGSNFPTVNPLQATFGGGTDAFVAKLNPAGSALVYSTYLGGSAGEEADSIAVDASGNAYIGGWTSSSDFPTVKPLQATFGGGPLDFFVAKLNAAGSALVYSTYLGGSSGGGAPSIAVDASGNAYISGRTDGSDLLTANPLQATFGGGGDAFVAKLNPTGSALVYWTYLGGSGQDAGSGLAVDASGNAYITGLTFSSDFPTANPLQATLGGSSDAFVAKLNPAGSALVYSTYLGGSGQEFGQGIAVDGSGNVYITGLTHSLDFPMANPLQATFGGAVGGGRDAFVAKISAPQPPDCSKAYANPLALWSPNHQFAPIAILGVTDPANNPITLTVTGVRQDEPETGPGSGNDSPDAVIQVILGGSAASVRAERNGNGNGRVYHIYFQADDGQGGTCTGDVTVGVPHSQGKGVTATDEGPIYDSTVP